MSAADLATWQARASALRPRHQAFIDGRFVDAEGGQTFATLNPANGQKLADVAPTAMIFVPCKDGISHNEIEDAKPDHLEAGANVLLNAMLQAAGRN